MAIVTYASADRTIGSDANGGPIGRSENNFMKNHFLAIVKTRIRRDCHLILQRKRPHPACVASIALNENASNDADFENHLCVWLVTVEVGA